MLTTAHILPVAIYERNIAQVIKRSDRRFFTNHNPG
jgi:hypothetical protein